MSPVDTYCRNLDYYIPEEGRTKNLKGDDMARIRKYTLNRRKAVCTDNFGQTLYVILPYLRIL